MVAFLDVGFKSVSGPLIWDSYTIRGGCLAGLQSAQERVSKSLIIGLGWTHGVRLKQTVTCCFFQTESGSIFDCLARLLINPPNAIASVSPPLRASTVNSANTRLRSPEASSKFGGAPGHAAGAFRPLHGYLSSPVRVHGVTMA